MTSQTRKEGGGILVAVLKKYSALRKRKWESTCEDLWLSIQIGGNKSVKINICAVYIPPPVSHDYLTIFLNNLTDVMNNQVPHNSSTLLVGDFNFPNIVWEIGHNINYFTPRPQGGTIDNVFLDEISFNNLKQYNNTLNANNRVLDLVFMDSANTLKVSKAEYSLIELDPHHPALELDITIGGKVKSLKSNRVPLPNYSKCDFDAVNEELSGIVWPEVWSDLRDIDSLVGEFYRTVSPIILKHTPYRKPHSERYPLWYSTALIKCLKEKEKYHKKYKLHGNPRDRLTFELLRDRSKSMIRSCFDSFKRNAAANLRTNPKFIWSYLNGLKRNSNSVPSQMTRGDRTVNGGREICDLFSEHFQSIYNESSDIVMPSVDQAVYGGWVNNMLTISSYTVSEIEVKKALLSLNGSKGAGLDDLPPIILKRCAHNLSVPLTFLFNISLSSGTFPLLWKRARVTPIFKKGDLAEVSNYRPVSILPAPGKVLESLVQQKMYWHVKERLHPDQHGFQPKKSTTSNLVAFVNDVASALDKKKEVHSIYTDFSKAFDLINHDLLINKIMLMGVHGSLLRWCESYLRNRSQLVSLRGYSSTAREIPSGVPQGSHIGPLFFLIFINDLADRITCSFKMYADDLKLYKTIDSQLDVIALQNELDRVGDWCYHNHMILNAQKCFHMKMTRRKNRTPARYTLNNEPLAEVNEIRDLGVLVDSTLSFRSHIDVIIKKASKLSGFISRQIKAFRNPDLIIPVYNSVVRSTLEYASPAWNPGYSCHSNRLEKIQKRFIHQLAYANNQCRKLNSYEARLKHYKVESLSRRRISSDIMFLYKIIHGLISCPEVLRHISIAVPRPSSRLCNRKTFVPPYYRTVSGQHSPLYRLISNYNNVRTSLDIFHGSVASAKANLKLAVLN